MHKTLLTAFSNSSSDNLKPVLSLPKVKSKIENWWALSPSLSPS